MTKIEYYSVLNIQEVCNELYFTPYTEVLRSVLQSLQKEFNAKYKGTPVRTKNNEFVYETVIDHYIISFIDCVFKTDIDWNRYFDETVMIIGDKK
ncbi:hypothetical protein CPT_Muenster_054 [Klebsiella phage Muenster]|nr:hypothetical protein CPT_Muenster_054 [Klebsiella phage Muenster]